MQASWQPRQLMSDSTRQPPGSRHVRRPPVLRVTVHFFVHLLKTEDKKLTIYFLPSKKRAPLHGGLSRALQGPSCGAEPHSCQLNIYQWFCLKAKGAHKKLCSPKVGCRSWKTHPKSTTHVAEPEQHQQVRVYEAGAGIVISSLPLSWTSPVLQGTEHAGEAEDSFLFILTEAF